MNPSDATIFIVDDDIAVRDSLALLLGLKGFRTQIFANAQNVLSAYGETWAGCMLIDVRMPGMDGMELQAQLRKRGCNMPILIMTAYGDVATARAALKGGAADFLEKPIDDEVLIDVLNAAIDASESPSANSPTARGGERPHQLTMREKQVRDLVLEGLQVKQIADRLSISPRTVEVYKSRVMHKLRARDVGDLAALARSKDADS